VPAIPRYLIERHGSAGAEVASAVQLAVVRFPEVAVEHRYVLRPTGRNGARELWVCRAPGDTHVRRWAAAARLAVDAISLIDGDEVP
jgi:hypothetical protein